MRLTSDSLEFGNTACCAISNGSGFDKTESSLRSCQTIAKVLAELSWIVRDRLDDLKKNGIVISGIDAAVRFSSGPAVTERAFRHMRPHFLSGGGCQKHPENAGASCVSTVAVLAREPEMPRDSS